jgi:hypothetical protein
VGFLVDAKVAEIAQNLRQKYPFASIISLMPLQPRAGIVWGALAEALQTILALLHSFACFSCIFYIYYTHWYLWTDALLM